jgi:hypothetical protein
MGKGVKLSALKKAASASKEKAEEKEREEEGAEQ